MSESDIQKEMTLGFSSWVENLDHRIMRTKGIEKLKASDYAEIFRKCLRGKFFFKSLRDGIRNCEFVFEKYSPPPRIQPVRVFMKEGRDGTISVKIVEEKRGIRRRNNERMKENRRIRQHKEQLSPSKKEEENKREEPLETFSYKPLFQRDNNPQRKDVRRGGRSINESRTSQRKNNQNRIGVDERRHRPPQHIEVNSSSMSLEQIKKELKEELRKEFEKEFHAKSSPSKNKKETTTTTTRKKKNNNNNKTKQKKEEQEQERKKKRILLKCRLMFRNRNILLQRFHKTSIMQFLRRNKIEAIHHEYCHDDYNRSLIVELSKMEDLDFCFQELDERDDIVYRNRNVYADFYHIPFDLADVSYQDYGWKVLKERGIKIEIPYKPYLIVNPLEIKGVLEHKSTPFVDIQIRSDKKNNQFVVFVIFPSKKDIPKRLFNEDIRIKNERMIISSSFTENDILLFEKGINHRKQQTKGGPMNNSDDLPNRRRKTRDLNDSDDEEEDEEEFSSEEEEEEKKKKKKRTATNNQQQQSEIELPKEVEKRRLEMFHFTQKVNKELSKPEKIYQFVMDDLDFFRQNRIVFISAGIENSLQPEFDILRKEQQLRCTFCDRSVDLSKSFRIFNDSISHKEDDHLCVIRVIAVNNAFQNITKSKKKYGLGRATNVDVVFVDLNIAPEVFFWFVSQCIQERRGGKLKIVLVEIPETSQRRKNRKSRNKPKPGIMKKVYQKYAEGKIFEKEIRVIDFNDYLRGF